MYIPFGMILHMNKITLDNKKIKEQLEKLGISRAGHRQPEAR